MFYIKQGDTGPAILKQVLDAGGAAINLTGASVRFSMASAAGSVVINRALAQVFAGTVPGVGVVTAADGWVRYAWVTGNTASAGQFNAEFELTLSDGSVETAPNSRHETVHISPAIA